MIEKSFHLNPTWLRQKYIDEGMSTYEIAEIVGRNPKNVYQKLLDFNIPTRTRAQTLQKNAWWKNGFQHPLKGKNHSAESKKKISIAATGRKGLCGESNPMFGKRSPNWKGGLTPERQKVYATEVWKILYQEVLNRDNYTCQKCGSGRTKLNKFNLHHIKSWAEFPEGRFDKQNIVTLCDLCHRWVHSSQNKEGEFIASPAAAQPAAKRSSLTGVTG